MAFSNFALSRDAWYGASVLLGATCGLFFRLLFKRKLNSALFTFNIYLLSAAISACAVVLSASRGAVLYDYELMFAALCFFGAGVLGGAFPIAAGFPLFALAGAALVWAGAVFWRYPVYPIENGIGAEIARSSVNGTVAVYAGDLLPFIGGQVRCLPKEPDGLLFREEFAVLSPAKNRLAFSFIAEKRIISSL